MSAYSPYSNYQESGSDYSHLHAYDHQYDQHLAYGNYSQNGGAVGNVFTGKYSVFYSTGFSYTTVPNVPTPDELSKYEYSKMPSGKILVTQGNQTIEFFSGVANVPDQCETIACH